MILPKAFYQQDTIKVAKDLLGKILVHKSIQGETTGRIVETEAYRGPEDKTAHSSSGRRTPRNESMFGEKGHAYIYFIYGILLLQLHRRACAWQTRSGFHKSTRTS